MSAFGQWRERRREAQLERLRAARAAIATMSPWARKAVYWAGGLLFASGIGMSGFFLSQLAEAFGIGKPFSFLLPAALDAGAVVGVCMWVAGTGEIELFGRRTARLLFGLSIVGNGLERMLTFAPGANVQEQAKNLSTLLGTGPGAWFLLAVSIGMGVVFPILAYQMGHAIILARKSADAPVRGRQAQRQQPQPPAPVGAHAALQVRVPTMWQRMRGAEATLVPTVAAAPTAPAPAPAPAAARVPAARVPDPAPTETIPAAASAEPLPYVHDSRDLEPFTAEWQDRYDRLPGKTKGEKLEHWLTEEWALGREPVLNREGDRVVGEAGKRNGSLVAGKLRKKGILPPSERPAPVAEPYDARTESREESQPPVRDDDTAEQPAVRNDGPLVRAS